LTVDTHDWKPLTKDQPKYQEIAAHLHRAITSGEYRQGQKLPSESQLVETFSTSRLTVQRALKELQHQGLIERRAGSGTYVRHHEGAAIHTFGLLIPGLGETEIFEPICQGMARAGQAGGHALLWGDTTQSSQSKERQTRDLCQHYIARAVSGVFFAPLELTPAKDDLNQQVLEALTKANIPVVLLDRCVYRYPRRSAYDLVGIDNRRAGFVVTEHLLRHGCTRPVFLAKPNSAPTVDARIQGFRDALEAFSIASQAESVHLGDPSDVSGIRTLLSESVPDGIVCANDKTAAHLLQSLQTLGVAVPQQIRMVGIDDVKYAGLLGVPLTTLQQPCRAIGEVAITTMLERIANPSLPPREVLLACKLVIRYSCGSDAHREGIHEHD
jgi:DNA-binding LacI/PurR family transcriptional regulator